ncbi:MAG TPA: recombinase family protein, partial [Nitrospiraceae bacterium]
HLIDIADDLNRRGVALKSITEKIDTTTPSGRFMFTHPSETKTTFLLYFAAPTGMKVACDGMGAVSIIGRWKPFV